MALRLMLDSNIADQLIAHPELATKLIALDGAGAIYCTRTYVQDNEHAQTRDPAKRRLLRESFGSFDTADPGVFVLDRPNLGVARFGSPESDPVYDAVHGANPKHIEDGIIAATALLDAHVLVTEDTRLAKKTLAAKGQVWTFADLKAYVEAEHAKRFPSSDPK
jgi:hypothetical protein